MNITIVVTIKNSVKKLIIPKIIKISVLDPELAPLSYPLETPVDCELLFVLEGWAGLVYLLIIYFISSTYGLLSAILTYA